MQSLVDPIAAFLIRKRGDNLAIASSPGFQTTAIALAQQSDQFRVARDRPVARAEIPRTAGVKP
jgi:hypothetical protein